MKKIITILCMFILVSLVIYIFMVSKVDNTTKRPATEEEVLQMENYIESLFSR